MSDILPDFADTMDDFKHYYEPQFADKTVANISKAVDRARKDVSLLTSLGEYKYNRTTYQTSNLAEALFCCAAHFLVVSTKFNPAKPNKVIAAETIGDKSISYGVSSSSFSNTFETTQFGQRYIALTKLAKMAALSC